MAQGRRGFTLIELLVVIAIIGILAGILLATVFQVMDRAKRSGAAHDIKNIENALNHYYEKYHSLPDDPYDNYAANASWAADSPTFVSFMYRLLGGLTTGPVAQRVNPSRAFIDASIRRLRSTSTPTDPKSATDVLFLDPWGSNPYLYVRGIMALSHPWGSTWPGNREKRCNLWSVGNDGLCQSCRVSATNFSGHHSSAATPPAPGPHRGGDLKTEDDINNWGGSR
ncbi:MAG: type II secretion system protein [Planctomycetes bacterium]|nr:type II secretion system protein [Planctomycetota bacterium]